MRCYWKYLPFFLYFFFWLHISQGGGVCNDPRNILQACQTPGSPNYDNKDFLMNYNICPGVSTSFKASIRWGLMDGKGRKFTQMAVYVDEDNNDVDVSCGSPLIAW